MGLKGGKKAKPRLHNAASVTLSHGSEQSWALTHVAPAQGGDASHGSFPSMSPHCCLSRNSSSQAGSPSLECF